MATKSQITLLVEAAQESKVLDSETYSLIEAEANQFAEYVNDAVSLTEEELKSPYTL